MDGGETGRGGTATKGKEGIARERITRSLPVAPARASASGRVAHCPSCFSRHRDHLLLPPLSPLPFPLASGPGGWMACSLACFSDPLFHRRSLSISLFLPRVRKPRPLSFAGPRCSETSQNGVTWPLLSRAHTPGHTLSPILLSLYPPKSALFPLIPPFHPCLCCIMHAPPSSTR